MLLKCYFNKSSNKFQKDPEPKSTYLEVLSLRGKLNDNFMKI